MFYYNVALKDITFSIQGMASQAYSHEILPLRPVANSFIPTRRSAIQIQPRPQDPPRPDPNLTKRQKRFVEQYIRNVPAVKARDIAGYAPSVDPWTHILSKPAVKNEIRRRLNDNYRDQELETDEIINGWRRVIDYNLLDYGYINQESGQFTLDLRNTTREQLDVVEGIEVDAYGRQKLRLPSKHAAREILARYKKILGDDKQGNGEGGKLTIESLDAMVKNYEVTINQIAQPQERKALPVIEAEQVATQ